MNVIRRFRNRALIEARLRAHVQQTLTAALEEMIAAGDVTFARPRAKPGPKSKRQEVLAWIGNQEVTPTLKERARKRFNVKRRTLDDWLSKRPSNKRSDRSAGK